MEHEDRPGYFWCSRCQDYILIEFTDHVERHQLEQSPDDDWWLSVGAFWLAAAAAGAAVGALTLRLL